MARSTKQAATKGACSFCKSPPAFIRLVQIRGQDGSTSNPLRTRNGLVMDSSVIHNMMSNGMRRERSILVASISSQVLAPHFPLGSSSTVTSGELSLTQMEKQSQA